MTVQSYLAAASFARPWLAEPRPVPERAGVFHGCSAGKAVYIACDYGGEVVYVGSSIRGRPAVAERVEEHLRTVRGAEWATIWSIPLHDDTPEGIVRRIEGLVGRFLRPRREVRLPAI